MTFKIIPIVFIFLFAISPVRALADCGWNYDRSFYGCDTVSIANSVGRTLPVLSDSIRFNPASLPTIPTPVGIEGTYSSKTEGDKKIQVSIIKGLPNFGFGFASWTENSFATPNVQRIINTDFAPNIPGYQSGQKSGFRLGGSLGLPLGSALERVARINVGASMGQGRVTGSSSKAFGITADFSFLSMGFSQNSEVILTGMPAAQTQTLSAGITAGGFYAGYSHMDFNIATYKQPTINFFSVRWASARWAFYAAAKNDIDENLTQKTYKTANLQFHANSSLVLGYVYGLYPGSHSASFQFYF